jgi:predicted homoserine dehydrogenase-like protein
VLDGEGGYTVWGRLMPATDALTLGGLPIGLAHGAKLKTSVRASEPVRWADVTLDETLEPVRVRRELEAAQRSPAKAQASV